MNCEFKILWVEDETVWFEAQARTVKDFLNSHYLNTVITHKEVIQRSVLIVQEIVLTLL